MENLEDMKKMIIVLAGNAQQADMYIRGNPNMVYASHPAKIMGIIAERVDTIGTFWDRKDASDLDLLAHSRVR